MLKGKKQRILRTLRPHFESTDFSEPLTEKEKQQLAEFQHLDTSLGDLLFCAVKLLEAPEGVDPIEYARKVHEEYWATLRAAFPDIMSLLSTHLDTTTPRTLAADAILKLSSLQENCEGIDSFSEVLQKATSIVASAALDIIHAEREKRANLISKSAMEKAGSAHEQHRMRKDVARKIWASKDWKPQADAERAIAAECHVTQAVAGRWIRDFKRS